MLLLHEVHTVAGRNEDEFEAAFRNGWMPTLGKDDDARLLYFLRLAHGTGRAYHTVTITALRDGAAYERLATRMQRGDLRSWASDLDLLRHEVAGKLLLPVDWSPMQDLDLTTIPADGREHDPVLYMEDERVAARGCARPLPRQGPHALRAESPRAHGAVPAHAARRVPGCARRAPAARSRAVAAGRLSRTPPGVVHPRASRPREGPGYLDARRARSPRRLGEPPASQCELVSALTDLARVHAVPRAARDRGATPPLTQLVLVDPVGEEAERHAALGVTPRDLTGCAVVTECPRRDRATHAPHVRRVRRRPSPRARGFGWPAYPCSRERCCARST